MRPSSPLLAWLAFGAMAFGQAESPPERERGSAPERLPKLDAPKAATKGTLKVQFVGAASKDESELREAIARQIQQIEESGLNAASAYDAGFFLESYYRKNGYPEVSATGQIAGRWLLRIVIKEGPLVQIGSVNVIGAKSYTVPELTNYLLGPTRERFPRIKADTELPFVETDIQTGADLVTRLYAADGFLDAVIDPPTFSFATKQHTAAVKLRIVEGTQYWFGRITFRGPQVFPRAVLEKAIAEELGKPFTPGRLASAVRKLDEYHKQRGYFIAKVDAQGGKENAVRARVPVTFQIEPGPQHRFDGVTLRGLEKVKPEFVQNRLMELRGETYSPERIDEKFRELIQTGLFKNLRIQPTRVESNQVRLDLDIVEAKTKEFGIGFGFASYEGAIVNLSYTDRNFMRTARPLTFSIEGTSRGYKGELLWSDPWLFESEYRFRARLYALTRENEGYTKREFGFQPSLARQITKHWEVSAFVLARQVTVTDSTIEPAYLLGPDSYHSVSLGLSSTLDFRNNPANPSRGFIGIATVDAASSALGSEIEFLRATVRLSYYIPITTNSKVAFGIRGGIIAPMGKTDDDALPIDERFFSGGANSVRSFAERDLGPKDLRGTPIGGQAFTVLNAEYTFPLFGDLKGAVFVDAGNLKSAFSEFGAGDLRYGVGSGLRYNLPFGPIRLDYGFNPSRKRGEDVGAFHFSIGVAF